MSRNNNNKRAGAALEAPATKRANKENNEVPQRRSARDRTQQKPPRQRMEEVSAKIAGDYSIDNARGTTDNAFLNSIGINPMAPEAMKTRRQKSSKKPENAPMPEVASLSIPAAVDIQRYASVATGFNVPEGNTPYNSRFPSPRPTRGWSTDIQRPQRAMADSTVSVINTAESSRRLPDIAAASQVPLEGDLTFNNLSTGLENAGSSALDDNFNTILSQPSARSAYDASISSFPTYSYDPNAADLQSGALLESVFSQLPPELQSRQSPLSFPTGLDSQYPQDSFLNNEAQYHINDDNSSVGSVAEDIQSSDDEGLNAPRVSDTGQATGSTGGRGFGWNAAKNALGKAIQQTGFTAHAAAGNAILNSPPVATPQGEYFVLDDHYERNRYPRAPAPAMLQNRSQQQSAQRAGTSVVETRQGRLQQLNERHGTRNAEAASSMANNSAVPAHLKNPGFFAPSVRRNARDETSNTRNSATPFWRVVQSSSSATPNVPPPDQRTSQASLNLNDNNANDTAPAATAQEPVNNSQTKTRAARNSKVPKAEKIITPDKQEFYPPNWQAVLKAAKLLLRLWIATQVPFPDKQEYYSKMLEFLDQALHDHQQNGGHVEEGYYQEHRAGMQKLIWDDIATFRGEIKTLARDLVVMYNFQPNYIPQNTAEDRLAYQQQIVANIDALLQQAFFLRDGVDENGRTNNFCHPVLRRLVLAAYYSNSSKVGIRFPGHFEHQVPRQALALAATALYCALKEWERGAQKNINFNKDEFGGPHNRMLELIAELENDDYQAEKLQAVRQQWARLGSAQSGAQAGTNLGFAVAL